MTDSGNILKKRVMLFLSYLAVIFFIGFITTTIFGFFLTDSYSEKYQEYLDADYDASNIDYLRDRYEDAENDLTTFNRLMLVFLISSGLMILLILSVALEIKLNE